MQCVVDCVQVGSSYRLHMGCTAFEKRSSMQTLIHNRSPIHVLSSEKYNMHYHFCPHYLIHCLSASKNLTTFRIFFCKLPVIINHNIFVNSKNFSRSQLVIAANFNKHICDSTRSSYSSMLAAQNTFCTKQKNLVWVYVYDTVQFVPCIY